MLLTRNPAKPRAVVVAELKAAVARGRRAGVAVLRVLAEFDERRLFAEERFSSCHEYCVRELGFSDEEAYERIRVARAGLRFPKILDRLEAGRLSMTVARRLAPHLNRDNAAALLDWGEGKTRRQIDAWLATREDCAPRADSVRVVAAKHLPAAPGASLPAAPGVTPAKAPVDTGSGPGSAQPGGSRGHAAAAPVAAQAPAAAQASPTPTRYRVAFDASPEVVRGLDRAKQLLWHRFPSGKIDAVLGAVLTDFLERNDPLRSTSNARRARVLRRDDGRCTFTDEAGRRCAARAGLEVDHVVPRARGGGDDDANLRTLCAAHNKREAERVLRLEMPRRRAA